MHARFFKFPGGDIPGLIRSKDQVKHPINLSGYAAACDLKHVFNAFSKLDNDLFGQKWVARWNPENSPREII